MGGGGGIFRRSMVNKAFVVVHCFRSQSSKIRFQNSRKGGGCICEKCFKELRKMISNLCL
jgi:recombinational DNA repair protein (RecF pathway)